MKDFVNSKSFEASAIDDIHLENHLDEAYKRDQETFEFINSSVRSSYSSWLPYQGHETCGQLHWSLCPNMCVIQDNLEVDFQDIRGNKMQQFRDFENDLKERKDRIIKDLEGKTYDISELEGKTKSEQGELEKLEDAFIIQSKHDFQVATKINEGLHTTRDSLNGISEELTKLNRDINEANIDCEKQAPCMATRNDIWEHHLETPEGVPPLPQASLNPGWGDFADWSQCSATCGAGQISKMRICTPKIEETGFKNFTVCDGYPKESIELKPCLVEQCKEGRDIVKQTAQNLS